MSVESKARLLIPLTVAGAFFMEGLDATILSTALPQIAAGFKVGVPEVSSAITSYLLSLAIFIPVSGWVADRFGGKRTYCAAIAIFTLGSVLCAMSTGPVTLALARGVQGVGGALMTPVGRLILAQSFPRDQLIHAMSFMIIPGLVGPVLGPVLGGLITTYASWHWIFLVNVPLGALGIALALGFLPPLEPKKAQAFDFRGFFFIVATLAPLQVGLDSLSAPNFSAVLTATLFLAAAFGAAGYIWHAGRRERPLIDLSLLRVRTFSVAIGAGFLSRIAISSAPFLLPILFQVVFRMTAFHSGLLIFAMAIGQIVMRTGTTKLLHRFGIRMALAANGALIGITTAGFALLATRRADAFVFAYLFVVGLIQCVQLSTLAALTFSGISSEAASRATALSSVVQRFAMSCGVAISAYLLQIFGTQHVSAASFLPVFFILGLIAVAGVPIYLTMRREDGQDLLAARRT